MERDAKHGEDRREVERARRRDVDVEVEDDESLPLDDVGPLPPEGMPVDDV